MCKKENFLAAGCYHTDHKRWTASTEQAKSQKSEEVAGVLPHCLPSISPTGHRRYHCFPQRKKQVVKRKLCHQKCLPSRDFSPNLKQDLSGLSGFFRRLRSKSCFIISGLSGFWAVYIKKKRTNIAQDLAQDLNGFRAVFLDKPLKSFKSCAVFERFFFR